jgi:hypothetical protein
MARWSEGWWKNSGWRRVAEKVYNRQELKKLLRAARNRRILHMPMEWLNELQTLYFIKQKLAMPQHCADGIRKRDSDKCTHEFYCAVDSPICIFVSTQILYYNITLYNSRVICSSLILIPHPKSESVVAHSNNTDRHWELIWWQLD